MPTRRNTIHGKPLLRMRIVEAGEPVYRARARVAAFAHRLGFSGEALDGIILAFSEAVNNAIAYGTTTIHRCVHVRVMQEDGHLVLEIVDHGKGFQPANLDLPAPRDMSEGGRGLFLMKAFMDDVQWLGSPTGTTVRMSKSRGEEL
jgi:serine/threonine-protein kinase RsbW